MNIHFSKLDLASKRLWGPDCGKIPSQAEWNWISTTVTGSLLYSGWFWSSVRTDWQTFLTVKEDNVSQGRRCVMTQGRWEENNLERGQHPPGVRNIVGEGAGLQWDIKRWKEIARPPDCTRGPGEVFIYRWQSTVCESGSEIMFLSSIGHGAIEWPWVEGGGMKTCDSVAWGFLHGCVSLVGDVCPLLMPVVTPYLLCHESHNTTVQNQEFPAACLHIGCPRIRLVVLA